MLLQARVKWDNGYIKMKKFCAKHGVEYGGTWQWWGGGGGGRGIGMSMNEPLFYLRI